MSKALTIRQSTPTGSDNLDLYLREVRKIPLLTREAERELADRWAETKDPEAARMLVLSNLRFVIKIARTYAKYGFRLPDLIQEGNLGLMHAVDMFNPKKGFRLISYAVWWIRAYIQAYVLRSWSIVRVGTTRIHRKIFASLQKARQQIAALNGSEAQNKQLAAALNVSESDLNEAMGRISRRDVSMEQPLSPGADTSFGESLADDAPSVEEVLISHDLQEKVRGKLDDIYEELNPRERFLLEHRLLAETPLTLEAAGKQFGVTRERVRQIEERLKGKLRNLLAPTVGHTIH